MFGFTQLLPLVFLCWHRSLALIFSDPLFLFQFVAVHCYSAQLLHGPEAGCLQKPQRTETKTRAVKYTFSTKEITKIIKTFKDKNSYGYDEISTKVLKISAPYISSPLTYL